MLRIVGDLCLRSAREVLQLDEPAVEGDHRRLTAATVGFAGARHGGIVNSRLAVACSEFEVWTLAYHPVTLRIGPWALVAPPRHERCDGGVGDGPPSCKLICMYLFILASWYLHAEGLVPAFVLFHCATLCGAFFVRNYVKPESRHSCRVFILCGSCRSYCYVLIPVIIFCAGCKYSILFA
jgi:hypothetical protein